MSTKLMNVISTKLLGRIRDGDDLWQYAKENGKLAVCDLLRAYIEHGQPRKFCEGYTTRAMCRIASKGIDGVTEEEDKRSYIDTAHGMDLYLFMWGTFTFQELDSHG